MRRWRWLASLVILLGLMSVVACTQAASLPTTTPSPSPETLRPPILSEVQAIEATTRSASFSAPEVTGVLESLGASLDVVRVEISRVLDEAIQ